MENKTEFKEYAVEVLQKHSAGLLHTNPAICQRAALNAGNEINSAGDKHGCEAIANRVAHELFTTAQTSDWGLDPSFLHKLITEIRYTDLTV